jgi:hypothetical protein
MHYQVMKMEIQEKTYYNNTRMKTIRRANNADQSGRKTSRVRLTKRQSTVLQNR